MWASQLVGDDFDASVPIGEDESTQWVIKQLAQHPLLKNSIAGPTMGDGAAPISQGQGTLTGQSVPQGMKNPKEEEERRKRMGQMALSFPSNGDGWFEHYLGDSAEGIVKSLRKARRARKDMRDDIDTAIKSVIGLKQLEVERTLKALLWCDKHEGTVRALGLSDRNLKSLRQFGKSREVSLRQACMSWEAANDTITKLAGIEGDFDDAQRVLWVEAMKKRSGAKQQWRNTLHQADTLNKTEGAWMIRAQQILEDTGDMLSSRNIVERMPDSPGLTVPRIGKLLKMYGLEYAIVRGTQDTWMINSATTLLLKDPWAYAAGFLDADGYITITKRGEPRAGIVATGDRGKTHCEQLHKVLECGVLQTELKVHKSSKRSQHRLQFYSKADLQQLLKGILPHLKMKKQQAHCVLELLELRGRDGDLISKRRNELERMVKWENWKDVKRDELLREWNVEEADVLSWFQRDPDTIRLLDDAGTLIEAI